jgi:uncharacterized membrane protein
MFYRTNRCSDEVIEGCASVRWRELIGALSLASVLTTAPLAVMAHSTNHHSPGSQGPDLSYCVYDLGPGLEIAGINNRNQIVGSAALPGDLVQGFVWHWDKGIRLVGLLPGAAISVAYDINDLGQVVGATGGGDLLSVAYIWDPRTGMRAITALGGDAASATNINNAGQIAGYATTQNPDEGFHLFFRDRDGEIQDVGPGVAFGLTNHGVLGLSTYSQTAPESEMFFWNKRTGAHQVPNLPEHSLIIFPENSANALSDRFEVVGALSQQGTVHAVRWTWQSGMQDLGTLSGAGYSAASGVNNWGTIVGWSTDGESSAIIWRKQSGMRALGDLIDSTSEITEQNAHLDEATDVNDFGWIAGEGYDRSDPYGARHGYVLVPKHNNGTACRRGPNVERTGN